MWTTEDDNSPNPGVSYESPAIPLPDDDLLIGTASSFDSLGLVSSQLQFRRLSSGSLMNETVAVEGSATALAISPDGSVIASGHENGLIYFWNASSAAEIGQPFRGPHAAVTGLAFAITEGELGLVSTSERGAVVWDFDPVAWRTTACKMAGRNLTESEWEALVGSGTDYHRRCPEFPAGPPSLSSADAEPSSSVGSSD